MFLVKKLQETIQRTIERSPQESIAQITPEPKSKMDPNSISVKSPIFEDDVANNEEFQLGDKESETKSEDEEEDEEDESSSESETKSEDEDEDEDEDEESEEEDSDDDEKSETKSEYSLSPTIPDIAQNTSQKNTSDSESDSDTDSQPSVTMEEAITQKELEKTDPTIIHEHTNRKFYYLSHKCEHSEHLTPKYSKLVPDNGLQIVLYLYTLCDHTYIPPFVSVLLEYNAKEDFYDFPQFQYTTENTSEDEDQHHKNILDKSLQKIYDVFQIKANETIDIELFKQKEICYKGLLEKDGDAIVLCIDVTPYLSHLKKDEIYLSKLFTQKEKEPIPFTWVLIDELLRHKTQNKPINPLYSGFVFSEERDFMKYVYNDGTKIDNPKLLYNCVYDDGAFETNIVSDNESIHLLAETSIHPKLGLMTFFSQDPLKTEDFESIYDIDRFVVFVGDCIHFKGKSDTWNVKKLEPVHVEDNVKEDIMDEFETNDNKIEGGNKEEKNESEKSPENPPENPPHDEAKEQKNAEPESEPESEPKPESEPESESDSESDSETKSEPSVKSDNDSDLESVEDPSIPKDPPQENKINEKTPKLPPPSTTQKPKEIKEVNHIYSCVKFDYESHTIYSIKSPNYYCIL